MCMADSRLAPSQWETSLQSNTVKPGISPACVFKMFCLNHDTQDMFIICLNTIYTYLVSHFVECINENIDVSSLVQVMVCCLCNRKQLHEQIIIFGIYISYVSYLNWFMTKCFGNWQIQEWSQSLLPGRHGDINRFAAMLSPVSSKWPVFSWY